MRSLVSHDLLRLLALASLGAAPFAAAITPAELSARLSDHDNVLIVDVRPENAFTAGHIPGAINIPASLLPYKRLPYAQLVVVCGDGLGMVDDAKAQAGAKVNAGVPVDTLAGGYAAWLAETRLSTAPSGVTREQMPGITYDRLLAGNNAQVMIVDLTTASSPAAAHALVAPGKTVAASAAPSASDLVGNFAGRLGVPVFKAHDGGPVKAAMKAQVSAVPSSGGANPPHTAALDRLDDSGKLLVLVADNEADADAAARQLRARGNYRFTILIGGTDAIRNEGRIGSGRMTGGVESSPSQN
jgi:rhodanese-related sulfurtransferase